MGLYLLAMRLPKEEYMGTCAWYFLILNWIKLPIFIVEGRIDFEAFMMDLPMMPLVLVSAGLGVLFLRKIKQETFENAIQILIVISALYLLLPKDAVRSLGESIRNGSHEGGVPRQEEEQELRGPEMEEAMPESPSMIPVSESEMQNVRTPQFQN